MPAPPRRSWPTTSLLRLPWLLLPLPVSSILKNASFWAIMGLITPPLVFVCSYSKEIREMSGGMASMLRPCESNEWACMSPERSTLVPIILCSIFSAFFSQPWIVHNFSVRASNAGSKTTLIFSYYLSSPSRDLNSRQFSMPSIWASALVRIRSIVSELASWKSIQCLSRAYFPLKSSRIFWVSAIVLLIEVSIFWFSDFAAENFSSKYW